MRSFHFQEGCRRRRRGAVFIPLLTRRGAAEGGGVRCSFPSLPRRGAAEGGGMRSSFPSFPRRGAAEGGGVVVFPPRRGGAKRRGGGCESTIDVTEAPSAELRASLTPAEARLWLLLV